jgi:hypothetical protein
MGLSGRLRVLERRVARRPATVALPLTLAERAAQLRESVRTLRHRAGHTGPNPLDRLNDADVLEALRQAWGPQLAALAARPP